MREAILYQQLSHQRVQCHVCTRQCLIAEGQRGNCGTRINRDGRLYSVIYNRVSAVCVDPIEKKPLYHFYPGTQVFSLGSLGCSFHCPGCQNGQISQRTPVEDDSELRELTPEQAIAQAIRHGAQGICWTYNEPAIWLEYTLACACLAKAHGLYTAYVTNGTASREHLDAIGPYLDAYRVDLKAISRDSYQRIAGYADYTSILDGVAYAQQRWGMHVECVTNVTPTINDSDEELQAIAQWIAATLGVQTPWHVTRFFPCEGLLQLPATALERLERAYALGRAEGLTYVYLGNVAGDARQATHCPMCGHTVVQRHGFTAQCALRAGGCPACGTAISGRWQ